MTSRKEKFGALIRREREGRGIGLREMAKMIGVSPTYLSKIERDEFPPPAEDKVKAIAKIIQFDADDLLARAGRVSSDITGIILQFPVELGAYLRDFSAMRTGSGVTRMTVNFEYGDDQSRSPELKSSNKYQGDHLPRPKLKRP